MQYKVPQNIDQEDKLLGPMTFTQFVYALIGGSILLIMFATLPLLAFLILGLPVLLLTIALSLIKVQDQPFTHFLISFFVFLKQPKHRVWHDLANPPQSDGLGTDFMEDVKRDSALGVSPPDVARPVAPGGLQHSAPALNKPGKKLTIQVEKGSEL